MTRTSPIRTRPQACRYLLACLWLSVSAACGQDASPAPGEEAVFAGIPFVWCPAGDYVQGSTLSPAELAARFGGRPEWYADETPAVAVQIPQGFWISAQEVTRQQWRAVMQSTPWGKQRRRTGHRSRFLGDLGRRPDIRHRPQRPR